MEINGKIVLKAGREKSLLRRHPWIFSGAVSEVAGDPQPGDLVAVHSQSGEFLAHASYSPHSQIRARVWAWNPTEKVDQEFIANRLAQAVSLRREMFVNGETDACRLVHGESDGLPGLVVDQFGEVVVVQISSWAGEVWREEIVEQLLQLTGAKTIYERSDVEVRKHEGLDPRVGLLAGEQLPQEFYIREYGMQYLVDIEAGHKTGFYLDQRANRLAVRQLAKDKHVLDCFSYTGGFGLNALKGGAKSVTLVDESGNALEGAAKDAGTNQLDITKIEMIQADVFQQLRKFRDGRKDFDLIILDPPKFAPTRANVEKAARGYKDINLLGFKLLRPGGMLVTFSCSGGLDAALFQKIVADSALDAGVDAKIITRLSQDKDHPVGLNFPEGEYLKGLVCVRS